MAWDDYQMGYHMIKKLSPNHLPRDQPIANLKAKEYSPQASNHDKPRVLDE